MQYIAIYVKVDQNHKIEVDNKTHLTLATWHLKIPGESLGAVDNSRHWKFSIWSTNKGVMVILVGGGYNPKKSINCMIMGPTPNYAFFALYPPRKWQ